jgi:hypothetical protein
MPAKIDKEKAEKLDKEPTVKPGNSIHTPKGVNNRQAHEGTKMGWSVPKSTADFFKDVRNPLIRSTPVTTFDRCPREFCYAYKLGIQPTSYRAPLKIGDMVHTFLQCRFLGQTEDEALSAVSAVFRKEQQRLLDMANSAGVLPDGKALESVLKTVEEDYHKARATALVFFRQVPFETDKWEILRTPDGDQMVEMLLEVEYPGLSRPIITKCDMALIWKKTGQVWIVDFKTTSLDTRAWCAMSSISPQMGIYRVGLQSVLDEWHEAGGYPKLKVEGALHAVIKKPGIKYCPNTKDKSGFDHYIQRLVEWYADAREKDPKNPPMVLDPHMFSGPLMTRELYGRLKQYCKASQASPNIDYFYRTGGGTCIHYNKPCPYGILCKSNPALWPQIIEQQFTIEYREDEEDATYDD